MIIKSIKTEQDYILALERLDSLIKADPSIKGGYELDVFIYQSDKFHPTH